MVHINTLEIDPPILNASCAWASEYTQLRELYDCPWIGAVTTRTGTLNGYGENEANAVVFDKSAATTLNCYGYSPHPLSEYLKWVYSILTSPTATGAAPSKPVLISITASNATILEEMLVEVQDLRSRLRHAHREHPSVPGAPDPSTLVGIELNTSCPNIKDSSPPAYNFPFLMPLLDVMSTAFFADQSLTFGLKLPPYLYGMRFQEVVRSISTYSRLRTNADGTSVSVNPFAYFACTNTLGTSLMFADQVTTPSPAAANSPFALASPLGGLGGEALHALALGNVYSFTQLLAAHSDPAMQRIVVIGIGGVTTPEAADRMRRAGAKAVACATLLGQKGIHGFRYLLV